MPATREVTGFRASHHRHSARTAHYHRPAPEADRPAAGPRAFGGRDRDPASPAHPAGRAASGQRPDAEGPRDRIWHAGLGNRRWSRSVCSSSRSWRGCCAGGCVRADPVASGRKTTERTTMDPRRHRMNSPMREAGPSQTPGSRFTRGPSPAPAAAGWSGGRPRGPASEASTPGERPSGSAVRRIGQPAGRDRGPGSRQRRDGGGHARLPR